MAFIRQDVWRLEQQQASPWHPIILGYALAVRAMRLRPAADPTSWRYQAAVHGTAVNRDQFRNQCQHQTWYFLPWHRMYLLHVESMMRAIVGGLPGVDAQTKAAWALPYWDYGRSTTTRALPRTFRELTLPDGSPNPLRVEQRNRRPGLDVNGGARLPAEVTSARFALRERTFSGVPGAGVTSGFGGGAASPNHFGAVPGQVELTPHGDVHTTVGGPGGLMSGFDTAPLDPIFWLHHANVDRLWEVWRTQQNPVRRNPTRTAWLAQTFDFHDAAAMPIKSTVSDFRSTADLDYSYADTSLPPGPLEAPAMSAEPPAHPAEMVGASDRAVELTGQRASVRIGMAAPEGPLSGDAGGIPSRVYLNVEDVAGEGNPGVSYGVYVTVPDEGDGADPHHVGNVSFFGIETATDLGADHPGGHGGMRFAFDISDLHAELRERGLWSDEVRVTFAPLGLEPGDDAVDDAGDGPADDAVPAPPPVRVGRVSVYVQ